MNLIERYLYSLSSYLPKENKEDILKEVESNIYDMLDGNYSEENVISVLKQLGNPRKLSLEYQTKKRYIIGPEYFDSYVRTLIFVVTLVSCIFLALSVFSTIISNIDNVITIKTLGEIIGKAFESFFDGAITAAIWVTIIFIIIERTEYTFDGKKVVKKSEWSPIMLKDIPTVKPKAFKKSSLIAEIFFNTFFTVIFITLAKYTGIYKDGNLVGPLFNQDRFMIYAYIFIFMAAYLLIMNIIMIYFKYPNYKVAIIKSIYNILNMIISLIFIFDSKLFNDSFKIEFISISNMTLNQYNSIWKIVTSIIAVIIVVTSIIEIIKIFVLSYKNHNQNQAKIS